VTAFCALQDVTVEMGPTVVWSGSHSRGDLTIEQIIAAAVSSKTEQLCRGEACTETQSTESGAFSGEPSSHLASESAVASGFPAELKKGDVLLMDSRYACIWNGGGGDNGIELYVINTCQKC
jgi:ectoine hydroxylase-related dioxygenase (phytanoyl-CoA dioxygenase family)